MIGIVDLQSCSLRQFSTKAYTTSFPGFDQAISTILGYEFKAQIIACRIIRTNRELHYRD